MNKFILALLPLTMCLSCSDNKSDTIKQQRDNDIDVSGLIEEFDMGDVIVGGSTYLAVTPTNLYFFDVRSTEHLVQIFDPQTGEYKGSGIDYGPGPKEIGQPDIPTVIAGKDGDKILIIDLAQWKVMQYDTDSLLSQEEYIPTRLMKIESNNFPSRFRFYNDTLGFAEKIWLSPNSSKFTKALAKFNLRSGQFEEFVDTTNSPASHFSFGILPGKDLIVTGDYGRDRLLFFDTDGNLKKTIIGPEYGYDGKMVAFSNIEITDKYVLAVYAGTKFDPKKNARELDMLGKKIVVMDHDGNYIATLDAGSTVIDMKYHEETGKLYLVLKGEILIGVLNLEDILSGKQQLSAAKPQAAAKPLPEKAPISFLNNDDKEVYSWNFGKISLNRKEGYSSREIITCNQRCNIEKFDIDSVVFVPDFIKGKTGLNFMKPGMISPLMFHISGNAPAGPFEGVVKIFAQGFHEPTVLPISGTIVYE